MSSLCSESNLSPKTIAKAAFEPNGGTYSQGYLAGFLAGLEILRRYFKPKE